MNRHTPFVFLATFLSVLTAWCQSPAEQRVQELLDEASRADAAGWAKLLIQADAEATKLTLDRPGPCCGVRCVRLKPGYDLHFRWNGIAQTEEYHHDLLKTVAHTQEGT